MTKRNTIYFLFRRAIDNRIQLESIFFLDSPNWIGMGIQLLLQRDPEPRNRLTFLTARSNFVEMAEENKTD